MGRPLTVGMVGCGSISAQYLNTFSRLDTVALLAVADLNPARARAVAAGHGVAARTVDELLADPGVDLVLNLTVPAAHADIALRAIAAGKSVYGEKPLATATVEGKAMLDRAAAAGVSICCAPDTVLGIGIQTARQAIDEGLVGTPMSATATMVTPGHERWHPNPDFYYQPGGGPLLDMGPYYITALITLLGPVYSVIGAASHTRDARTIGTGTRAGEQIPVTVDSHVTGVLVHESGALSTLLMSFDAAATHAANIEIHGNLASLAVPDPNHFDGDVLLARVGQQTWTTLPISAGYVDSSRGIGIADLAGTLPGHEPRLGGRLAYHVLDIMESLLESAHTGRSVTVNSSCERPSPVPLTHPSGWARNRTSR